VIFSRLFLIAFFAFFSLAPTIAWCGVDGLSVAALNTIVISKNEAEAFRPAEALVLNNDSLTTPLANSFHELAQPSISTPPPSDLDLPFSDIKSISPSLTTDTNLLQNDLWQRIRNGFAMQEFNSPLIARHEQWYANRPDYVARMMDRSQRYLFFITEEVEKRGMPTEIALLPMIESAFNPGAYSIGNASGIWQFIPSTGRNFGLRQNWWYDGRRDIVNATKGALDYLQKLHNQFGDWELALAAYNWGEGAVERAQQRNKKLGLPTNYGSLKMPDETRNYLPKLFAIKNIVSNPSKFGLPLPSIPDQPYFVAVNTARHIDVKLAAKLANISQEEFTALNPAHNRPVILQENDNVLLLPVDKAESFRTNLENCNEPLVSWQAYQSKHGERLDRVAPRFGLSVEKLKSINGLSQRAKLSNGQSLLVPLGEDAKTEFEAFDVHLIPTDRPSGRSITHLVKKGDTLASLSHRYHVSVGKIKNANGNLAQLKPGKTISIVQSTKQRHASEASKNHTVKLAGNKNKKHTVKLAVNKNKKHLVQKSQRHVKVAYNH
jgi:membrane-bound lytic murein transglycosylase D